MPLYEYRCAACSHRFESLLDRWDSPAPPCPHCGESSVRRQWSVFAVGTAPESRPTSPPRAAAGACRSSGCACRPASN
ncbi:MAG: zinc ribbon domain-containing protein [Candidatus Eisenbacteria bacterium]|nr:zinc ribbon domain-containing protein [Candidatus Eisenbacteria bacterium]